MIELNSSDSEQIDLHPNDATNKEEGALRRIIRWNGKLVAPIMLSLLLALAALFVLLTPVLNAVFGLMGLNFAVWNQWIAWATEMDRGLLVAVVLGLAALLVGLLARYRMRRDYSLYVEAGCPQCHENELIRVQRHGRDRLLGYFGFPVRRYSCRNCTWHGLRFAGYVYSVPDTRPEADDTEPLLTEPAEAFDYLTAEELPGEPVELEVPTDYDWSTGNGAVAANEGEEDPLDFDESQANFPEVAIDSNHEATVGTVEEISDEITDSDERRNLELEAETGSVLTAAVQIEETRSEESRHFDDNQRAHADTSDENDRDIVAEDTVAASKAETVAAADVQEEMEAGEEENGSESDAPVVEDEEFERLCEEVALSK